MKGSNRLARMCIAALCAALIVPLSGCGAVIARARIASAESALGSARRAKADSRAVYEFTSASLYLEKAREEEAYGRFGNAIEWSGLAEELAEKAKLASSSEEPPSSSLFP